MRVMDLINQFESTDETVADFNRIFKGSPIRGARDEASVEILAPSYNGMRYVRVTGIPVDLSLELRETCSYGKNTELRREIGYKRPKSTYIVTKPGGVTVRYLGKRALLDGENISNTKANSIIERPRGEYSITRVLP